MRNKTCVWVFLAVIGSFFIAIAARAQDAQAPSTEQQLSEILKSQKILEQRLTAIESQQAVVINTLRAMQGGPRQVQAAPPSEDMDKVYNIDIGHSSIRGNKDAKVTIVEFSDFQCPFSQRFHPAIPEVLKVYPKDVNYVLKDFPLQFHPQAKPAAKAALAAREQGKYWEMVELLFQSGQNLTEDKFQELAKQLGLNVKKFMKDYKEKDADWEKLIAEDMAVANASAVRGTPTFFINGRKTNARDLPSFKAEIDRILQGGDKGNTTN